MLFTDDPGLRFLMEVMVGASFCEGNGGDPADQKRDKEGSAFLW